MTEPRESTEPASFKAHAARRDPYQRAADDEAARRAQAAKAAETYAHRREVEALMRPGGRHG